MFPVHHTIISTEKVPFTYRVAGIGARFSAWLIDALFITLLAVAGALVLGLFDAIRPGIGSAAARIWIFGLTWGWFLCWEWLWIGQTPGKRVLGIRVIQQEGSSIGFYHAAVRNVLRVVDSLPVFYAVGFAVMACDVKTRRLGDWAAGTLVVHVERRSRPILTVPQGDESARPREALLAQRLGQLAREQKQTLLDLCLRRDQLRIEDRARLFRAVRQNLQSRLELQPEPHQSDEKFVLALAPYVGTMSRDGGSRTEP